eukprot:TRINITY_DN64249_c0_g1_i1.p1 TRINITY_DN64249_c0_g1~~TRINITY_DN64249_c0_g1_i1.p1  ORF type:complete len:238 (+),score=28.79 TRINITY_DN64249_c0_g1_i1:98-811(+)
MFAKATKSASFLAPLPKALSRDEVEPRKTLVSMQGTNDFKQWKYAAESKARKQHATLKLQQQSEPCTCFLRSPLPFGPCARWCQRCGHHIESHEDKSVKPPAKRRQQANRQLRFLPQVEVYSSNYFQGTLERLGTFQPRVQQGMDGTVGITRVRPLGMAAYQHQCMKYDSKQRLGLYGVPGGAESLPQLRTQSRDMPDALAKLSEARAVPAVAKEGASDTLKRRAMSVRILPIACHT